MWSRSEPVVGFVAGAGFTTMLKMTVPTWANGWPACGELGMARGGLAVASMRKTSSSGRENRTALSQVRPRVSTQCEPLNLRTRPVSGPVTPFASLFGAGRPPGYVTLFTVHDPAVAPPLQTTASLTVVVWLPEWKTPA